LKYDTTESRMGIHNMLIVASIGTNLYHYSLPWVLWKHDVSYR
jgi:hypothetical protein